MSNRFANTLLKWFDEFGRKNLPWQKKISPYRVWISEIMLQQTQVIIVVPYFENFVKTFPNVKALSDANLDAVLHLWTGLGYYARARNIHKTAHIIVSNFKEKFPDDITMLMSLPGIGRSTAGAILSIAFQKATPILDGNVKRVLTRYHGVAGFPGEKEVENKLWSLAASHTPEVRCADYTQAIMDLGATVCTRTQPSCTSCPMKRNCIAYQEDKIALFPQSKPKPKLSVKNTAFLILKNKKGEIFLEKRPPLGIWGGLWGFPEYNETDVIKYCREKFNCTVDSFRVGESFRHTFSHFHLDISPIFVDVKHQRLNVKDDECIWCLPATLPKVGLAAPIKKLLLLNEEFETKKE